MIKNISKKDPDRDGGKGWVGSYEPVRIQSMLTSETTDLDSVMLEIQACIMLPVKWSASPSPTAKHWMRFRKCAEGCLRKNRTSLIADIHFNPQLAVDSCEFFEKVRINPGNYADRKKFEIREYSNLQYAEELERIEETLLPLVKIWRPINVVWGLGRIMVPFRPCHEPIRRFSRRHGSIGFGIFEDFEKHDFYDTILSMKSSNPLVMKEAYRLLVMRMEEESMDYPLHLGVTEAGMVPKAESKVRSEQADCSARDLAIRSGSLNRTGREWNSSCQSHPWRSRKTDRKDCNGFRREWRFEENQFPKQRYHPIRINPP